MLQGDCAGSFDRFKVGILSALIIVLVGFLSVLVPAQCASAANTGAVLKISRILPSGVDVPPGRQIVFEFDRPVVPLGRMERNASEVPINIEPGLSCQWRWLNPSSLACQLDEQHAMLPATRYNITVSPQIRSEDGASLAAPVSHSFVTQRPKITGNSFQKWVSPGMPSYRVYFNQPVRKDSLEAHLYFKTEKGGRVAAKISEDKRAKSEPGMNWFLVPLKELPPESRGSLVVEPGVVSLKGPEPGVDKRDITTFQTLPPFRFLGVQCMDLKGQQILLKPEDPFSPKLRCSPAQMVSLLFSSPAMQGELRQKVHLSTGGKEENSEDLWTEGDYSRLSDEHNKAEPYVSYLDNDALKPFAEYRIQAKAKELKDEFGRFLVKDVDMRFAMDHRPPDLHLFKNMSVLEKGLDTDLPILATNLEQVELKYEVLTADSKSPTQNKILPFTKKQDKAIPIPLGIRGLIARESGIVSGNIITLPKLREKDYQPNWFVAQVTPFHVHVKLGHFNTVVWVTDLQSGQPVSGVTVRIQKDSFQDLGRNPTVLSEGTTDSNGVAQLDGTAKVDPQLTSSESFNHDDQGLVVWCQKNSDVALVPLRYDFRVDSEGSNNKYIPFYTRTLHGHINAWGATAQGIYKVGDTVQFKIYVRDQENRRFVQPKSGTYGLKVRDPSGKVIHQRDGITLSEFGAFDGEFTIPKNGAVGQYRFSLNADFAPLELEPLQVLVSDFTPSPFRVTAELNGSLFGTGDNVKVSTQAKLHAGGPYGNAAVRIAASVEPRDFRPDNPGVREFQFDVFDKDEGRYPRSHSVFQTQGKLDNDGNMDTQFTLTDLPIQYGKLGVESSVKDERGKSVAAQASAVYFGRDRYVGLLQTDWLLTEGKSTNAAFAVVDEQGKLIPDIPTRIDIEKLETKAARVKEAGDAYPAQYTKEWVQVEGFDLTSGTEPQTFQITPKQSGTMRIVARISDTRDRVHKTVLTRWVSGKSYVLWEAPEGNVLNMYPEKEEYHVGDTARFFVQNPLPGGKVLITVERYGVLDHWVKTLEGSSEVLEIPVLPDYLPGFYFSATVMSPRVEKPMGPGGEDLGKPTFRTGYARIEVKDKYKEIEVKCTSDKEVYKPRETVKLEFEASPRNLPADGKKPPIELAVAVLDEAVFDLLKQKSQAFDPYKGFYKLEDLDLTNYNLIMQLVGREKLEKKGADPAAGAGFDLSMRSVFKFVSYWNPSLRLDENGKASAQFQLPDNLTGWRILSMAVTPDDRMGLGETTFKVNQSTEIRPVMPNQVLEGDTFSAGFSVMNRTGETRNIEVRINATGECGAAEGEAAPGGKAEAVRTITAEPYKRYTVRLPLKAAGPGSIAFSAQAGDERDRDGMKHTLKVLPRKAKLVSAVYGTILTGEVSQAVEFPDMYPGSGLLGVTLSPSILGGLDGAFDYMKRYPHECWEQKISRAVMAGTCKKLAPYFPKDFSWEGSAAEVEKILAAATEFQAPNGGMAFYLPKDGYVSPFLSAFTAQAFNWLREAGYTPPAPVEEKLQKYLLELLKRDGAEDAAGREVLPNVRALALAALAERSKITMPDLERQRKYLPEMNLFGKASFMEALVKFPGTSEIQKELLQNILSHSNQTSGTIRFTEQADSSWQSMLSSAMRDNAAILLAFLSYQKANPANTELGEYPVRLMQAIELGRKTRPHWASTQENVYAAMATLRYSGVYENTQPQMNVESALDQQVLGKARFQNLSDRPVTFDYAVPESDIHRKAALKISKEGEGRMYYATRLAYAPAEISEDSVNAGIEIHREYSIERDGKWVLPGSPMEIKTGDLVRVDLLVSLPAERYFVVVEDPVPGGLEPVNRDLATASQVDSQKAESAIPSDSYRNRYSDWRAYGLSRWSFYHKELRHHAACFYSERLSPGNYHLSYTAQAIAPGQFTALPAHAEEMYNPDVYGSSSGAVLKVQLPE